MDNIEFYSKDVQIMRQSQQKFVLDYCNSLGVKITILELQKLTDLFVDLCLAVPNSETKTKIKKTDEWLQKKIKEVIC